MNKELIHYFERAKLHLEEIEELEKSISLSKGDEKEVKKLEGYILKQKEKIKTLFEYIKQQMEIDLNINL